MQKASELREKQPEELTARFHELSKELFELRNELYISRKIDKPHRIKEMRREQARILTVMNEKRQGKR